jgi:hypothetical protein
MGAVNPRAAAQRRVEIACELGLKGLKVACIQGDDVSSLVPQDQPFMDEPGVLSDVGMPSLNLDSHGKSWSYLVLGLELEERADDRPVG